MTSIAMAVNRIGLSSFVERIKSISEDYARYKAYKATVKQLNQLTDRELYDIGLSRGMIHSIAMEIYYDGRTW
jgi:uncharacterized protein YjiS (DUF1127 family)